MIDRDSVLRRLRQHIARADYIDADWMDCVDVGMLKDALELLRDRTTDYECWAKAIGVRTCATCARASDNRADGTRCPIEKSYALVKDGYCHLWEET